ncbi:MAG: type II toxin-antitoxin system TacA family antitoxin [Mycobacteriales bacterium]
MGSLDSKNRRRINLRVDPDQEARLRAAAEANGETLAGFMRAAATERADQVLERAGRIAITAAAFERFVSALEGQVAPMPTLSRYAHETGPIPAR